MRIQTDIEEPVDLSLNQTMQKLPLLITFCILAAAVALKGEPVSKLFSDHTKIVFQGDSITHGGRGSDPNHIIGHSYVILIAAPQAANFPEADLSFYNRGISGNTIGSLDSRWQNDTLNLKPDTISILVGVNDLLQTVGKDQPFIVADYEKTYRSLLDRSRAANPKVRFVLCQPFVMPGKSTSPKWEAFQKGVAEMQAVVEKLAAEYHAPVVHLQQVFDKAAKEHTPVEYWVWDGVHPTFAGHQLVADEWIRTYRDYYK